MGGACFLGGRWSAGRSENVQIDAVVLQNQLTEIRELATVTYAYTNMAQFESSNDFYGVKVPFTTKSFILTYDGTIKAGVDLDGAEVNVSGTAVTITLPEARILSHGIDEDSVEVFDEKTSIFNPLHGGGLHLLSGGSEGGHGGTGPVPGAFGGGPAARPSPA